MTVEGVPVEYHARFMELLRESKKHWAYYEAGAELNLGELFYEEMEKQGMDLEALSKKANISLGLLKDLFGGSRVWNLRLMSKVAFALEMELFFGLKKIDFS